MHQWNSKPPGREAVFESFAHVLKAVANPRRLELLELLAQGEHNVESLAQMSGMGMTTASAHLQQLKRTGLVTTRRERTTVFYRMAGDDIAELYSAAKQVALNRYPQLRHDVEAFLGQPRSQGPVIDPSAVTEDMVVVDVRPRNEYEAGHFPGSVSIPLDELEGRYREIPRDAEVVVYCRGEFCSMARDAAVWLRGRGIDAKAMDEGVVEWRATKEVDLDVA